MFDPRPDPRSADRAVSLPNLTLSELEKAELTFFPAIEHFLGKQLAEPQGYLEQELTDTLTGEMRALVKRRSRSRSQDEPSVAKLQSQYPRIVTDENGHISVGALFTLTDDRGKTIVCDDKRLYSVPSGAVVMLGFATTPAPDAPFKIFSLVPLYSPEAFDAELYSIHGTTLKDIAERSKRSFLLPQLVHYARFCLRQFAPSSRLSRFEISGSLGSSIVHCGDGRTMFEILPLLSNTGKLQPEVNILGL